MKPAIETIKSLGVYLNNKSVLSFFHTLTQILFAIMISTAGQLTCFCEEADLHLQSTSEDMMKPGREGERDGGGKDRAWDGRRAQE